jgi:hypothetical protein
MDTPNPCTKYTDHHVPAMVMGLRCWGFPRSIHGVVELIPRDQAPTIQVIVTSDSRTSEYRGRVVLLLLHIKPSEMLSRRVQERCLIHTVEDCALLYVVELWVKPGVIESG